MTSLAEEIKKRMFAAMKAGSTAEKEILRVATGEITMTGARESRDLSDEDVRGILRKMLKSVRETLAQADAQSRETLQTEESVLLSLLPKALGVDELVAALEGSRELISAAAGDGPAMGIAMKALKSGGITAEAQAVTLAVQKIRAH